MYTNNSECQVPRSNVSALFEDEDGFCQNNVEEHFVWSPSTPVVISLRFLFTIVGLNVIGQT